jgi:tripeptidyl-peptidase I
MAHTATTQLLASLVTPQVRDFRPTKTIILLTDAKGIDATYPDPHPNGYKGPRQCGVYKPTKVISISYLQAEKDFPVAYQKRQCNEFMKLGLQGHSIFVASGDYGTGLWPNDAPPDGCLNSTDPAYPSARVFSPADPATCPWITSVGGTRQYPGQSIHDPESVMHLPELDNTAGSGGGFSNIYDAPPYQKAALREYFSRHDPGYTLLDRRIKRR